MTTAPSTDGNDKFTGAVSEPYQLSSRLWPNRDLTYSFVDSASMPARSTLAPGDFAATAPIDVRALFRDAVTAWENACGVNLVEVADGAGVDIRIGWLANADGSGGTLGTATWWFVGNERTQSEIGFDPADYRAVSDEVGFYDTALHELGHAIGISHSDVENVVMSGLPTTPYSDVNPGRDRLTADDIAAAQAIWGPPTRPPVTLNPPPPPTPNPPPGSVFNGTGGNDTLNGGDGNDIIYGEGGADALLGGDGNDTIYGAAGNDRLWGQDGDDHLFGDAGNDRIFGESGSDTINGGDGEDIILSGAGDDSIYGGDDFDRVWGGAGNDTIHGGDGRNFLAGDDGADSITGGAGVDIVIAGEGNDSITGGGGSDRIIGGDGNDTIEGGAGGSVRSYLNGGAGDDFITGGADADYLDGEGGNDTLIGGASRDVLAGGAGNDILVGGDEGDTFFGQGGADVFVIEGGRNWVMDFDSDDRLAIGMSLSQVQAAATQFGPDLHIALAGRGDLYLAATTLAEIEADNLMA